MEKTFTVNVPDDLWVDSWTENKTTDYTYNGPSTINVLVSLTGDFPIVRWSEDDITVDDEDKQLVVTIDADTDTAIAHAIVNAGAEHEYTYTTITNHDDSTHEEINNPTINDIYEVEYTPANGFVLKQIIKESETMNERTAKERLAYVVKYDEAYDFDDATQTVIDTFKTNIDNYLTTMSTVYPWRYVTIDATVIPKIPASLVATFNTLPDIS